MLDHQDRADLVAQAMSDVMVADVISIEAKRAALVRLAEIKPSLGCGGASCHRCANRKRCENLVERILGSA